jgi:hypothetical protein
MGQVAVLVCVQMSKFIQGKQKKKKKKKKKPEIDLRLRSFNEVYFHNFFSRAVSLNSI